MDQAVSQVRRKLGDIQVSGPRIAAIDRAYMDRALQLARQGMGHTHPNPMVGCVIVKDGRIIGEGYHRGPGHPHAEVEAVASAGGPSMVKGSTIYVNLEPCAHHGRTPPCADLLVQCQPAEVVVSHQDPNPQVAGRGLARLRAAGITVIEGVAEEEARALNEAWLAWITRDRPFVALKYAMTLDGKIAARGGHSRWITNEAARRHGHALRNKYDAILVGVGTVLADDPRLTCRIEGGRDPIRIVLDSWARTPVNARVLPAWIFTSLDADPGKVEALDRAGARVWQVPRREGQGLDLAYVLNTLAEEEVISLLVEGGSHVHRSFLENNYCDKLYLYLGAKTVGGDDAPGPVAGPAVTHLSAARTWNIKRCHSLSGDLCCEVYPAGSDFGVGS